MTTLLAFNTLEVYNNLIYAVSVLLAAACGAAIGMERKSRLKEAGLRTHVIVAISSAVMMIISKYGFYDVIGEGIKLDPSRIGAGVATAVSFLGAGIIFMRKDTIIGLTTAAGLWGTVGVGMAAGSGMYTLAVFATLLILGLQVFTHKYSRLERNDIEQRLVVRVSSSNRAVAIVEELLLNQKIEILNLQATRDKSGMTEVEAVIKCPDQYNPSKLFEMLDADSRILSVEL